MEVEFNSQNEYKLGDNVWFWKEKNFLFFDYLVLANGRVISIDDKIYIVKSGNKEYFLEKKFCFASERAARNFVGLCSKYGGL
jgi:hypothetical protein